MREPIEKRRTTTSQIRTAKTAFKPPAYRQRRGYDQALVTLTDARTKQRRDYWLGPFDSPESRAHYHRLIAEWVAGDHRLPARIEPRHRAGGQEASNSITVNEIVAEYW